MPISLDGMDTRSRVRKGAGCDAVKRRCERTIIAPDQVAVIGPHHHARKTCLIFRNGIKCQGGRVSDSLAQDRGVSAGCDGSSAVQ